MSYSRRAPKQSRAGVLVALSCNEMLHQLPCIRKKQRDRPCIPDPSKNHAFRHRRSEVSRKITTWPFSSHKQHSRRIIGTSGRTKTMQKISKRFWFWEPQEIKLLHSTPTDPTILMPTDPTIQRSSCSLGRHIALPSPRPALLMPESNISTAKKGVKLSRLGRPPGSKCAEARHRNSC